MARFPNPLDLFILNRGGYPGDGHLNMRERVAPVFPPQPEPVQQPDEGRERDSDGYISMAHNCQTTDASKICIYDICKKLDENGDCQIGGTYTDTEPDFWFFFTSSICHGNNRLVNLFVCHRKTGNFSIQLPDTNALTQKAFTDDVPHLLLPNTLNTSLTFKSTKPNQNYFLKTFCFSHPVLWQFNPTSTLIIPIKIEVNPKFSLDNNIINSIKLQHDLSRLMTKQEKTDFVLESATHKQFPTHKILLAAHSPVLRNMIKNVKPTSLFIDISDTDMDLLLEFIYTGTFKNVMKQDCLKLLEIADKFQLRSLFMLTQHVISDQINVTNAVEMAVIAKKYNLVELQNKVFEFIIKNPEVMQTDAWINLNDVELTKYLFQYMHTMRG